MRRARGYAPLHVSAEQDALLERLVARAKQAAEAATASGGLAVGVFDLDGCLFDTRHRQIQILRELGSREGLPELYRVAPEHFVGWDLAATLTASGLSDARAQQLYPTNTIFHVNAELHEHGCICRARNRCETRIDFKAIQAELDL